MNRKIFLWMFVFIILLFSVNARTVYYSLPFNISDDTNSPPGGWIGINITPMVNITVYNISKLSVEGTSGECRVYNGSKSANPLAIGTFSSSVTCVFPSSFQMLANHSYWITRQTQSFSRYDAAGCSDSKNVSNIEQKCTGANTTCDGTCWDFDTLGYSFFGENILDVTINSPANLTNINQSTDINFSVDYNQSAVYCNMTINDTLVAEKSGLTNKTYVFSFNSTDWTAGYNLIRITCLDGVSPSADDTVLLFVDSTSPQILFINRTSSGVSSALDTSVFFNQFLNFSIRTFDNNNYYFNVTVRRSSDNFLIYSYNTSNVSKTYQYNGTINFTNNKSGTYKMTVVSADGHTLDNVDFSKNLIEKDYDTLKEIGKNVDKIKIYSDKVSVIDYTLVQFSDRKKEIISFQPNVRYFNLTVEGEHSIDYIGNQFGYEGHMIIDKKYWKDQVNYDGAKVIGYTRISDKKIVLHLEKDTKTNIVTFNSIGLINFVNQTVTFDNAFFELTNCSTGGLSHNFTFKDEQNSSIIRGDYTGTFIYTYQSQTKSLNLSGTNVTGFQICTNNNVSTFTGNYSIVYDSDYQGQSYEQRYSIDLSVSYSNITQNIDLPLLLTSQGLWYTFYVTDATSGEQLPGTVIIMERNGILVESRVTDDTGQATFFPDPTNTYLFTYTKTGYNIYQRSINPAKSETINIQLQRSTTAYNVSDFNGVTYNSLPATSPLINGTLYNFSITLNSTYRVITQCNFSLINGSSILTSISGTYDTDSCNATIEFNVLDYDDFRIEMAYTLNNSLYGIASVQYAIIYSYQGQFSLMNFIDDINDFSSKGFNSFTRMVVGLIIILVITGLVSGIFSTVVQTESVILIFLGLVLLFSYFGWFTLTFSSMPNVLGLKQYFIFYICLLGGGAFILDKIRNS